MNEKKFSRINSFLIIAVVYLLATVVGILLYKVTNFHFAISLLLADIAATIFVFIFSLIFKNASVYDPYWSVQPAVIITAFAIKHGVNLLGIMLLIAIWFWAVRLTANWAYTFKGLDSQDWRYTMLKEKTGSFYPIINFVGIHLVPTLVVYGCVLPVVYAIVYGYEANIASIIFCALAILSATLQGIADIQMHSFRKKKVGGFIRDGLWKYSRHPNYLGEILQWWNVALAVVICSQNWLLILGAVFNTLLFIFVSIPLADGRQSKKEGWEEYKKQTRNLLPIYKKQ